MSIREVLSELNPRPNCWGKQVLAEPNIVVSHSEWKTDNAICDNVIGY